MSIWHRLFFFVFLVCITVLFRNSFFLEISASKMKEIKERRKDGEKTEEKTEKKDRDNRTEKKRRRDGGKTEIKDGDKRTEKKRRKGKELKIS